MKKRLSTIEGFESCEDYIVYDDGRIYSEISKRFLKHPTDSKGYKYLDIRDKGATLKCPKIHQLVMLAFSDEEQKEHINHLDGDKSNNSITNLQYVSNRENRIHAIEKGLKDEINYGIAQYDLSGRLLNVFDTARDALIHIGANPDNSGNIGRCVRGSRESAYGFKWGQYEGSTTISKESTL